MRRRGRLTNKVSECRRGLRRPCVIALYYHNSAVPIEFEDLEEVLTSGQRAGEARTYARKREFDTSPSGGEGENNKMSPLTCANTLSQFFGALRIDLALYDFQIRDDYADPHH